MMKSSTLCNRIGSIVLVATAIAGCSGDLSREEAFTLIAEQEAFKEITEVTIPVGSFWYDWRSIHYGPVGKLAEAELLTIREVGQRYNWWWQQYLVELTPTGTARSAAWTQLTDRDSLKLFDYGPTPPEAVVYRIPLAEKRLNEVTGLGVINENQRQADFTWQWVPTVDAELHPDKMPSTEVYHGAVLCQRYDDGWRVVQLDLHN